MTKGPVLIDLEDSAAIEPASAPPVPDLDVPQGHAAGRAIRLASRPPSRLASLFWASITGFVSIVVTVTAWGFVTNLLSSNPLLGTLAATFAGLAALVLLVVLLREWLAFSRLRRLDRLGAEAARAIAAGDLAAARKVKDHLMAFYAGREDLAWARDRVAARDADMFDADALLGLVETELLAPLDAAASREIEAAARQVATVTAVVPLAFADVAAALLGNVRMIRRIAEVYGGRGGVLGSWRLVRSVMTHLVATGAVAVGDDMLGSLAGGSILSRLSRRFGEGVVNGALTARVGIAAIEVCRPMPFRVEKRPGVSQIIRRALSGLFDER